MPVEINKPITVRLTPKEEVQQAKPTTELYIGQVLKTVVIAALSHDQVKINIDGQHLNAKVSHPLTEGDVLHVKVLAINDEIILEVQEDETHSSVLQSALLEALPKQAPATALFKTFAKAQALSQLPIKISILIRNILTTVIHLNDLPRKIIPAIKQSGVLLEASLMNWEEEEAKKNTIKRDFKGLCLQLLAALPANKTKLSVTPEFNPIKRDTLPLPGAIPQPLPKDASDVVEQCPIAIQSILRMQTSQVLARIIACQINHLFQSYKGNFYIMLDLPIQTNQGVDVIPLMIKQYKAIPMHPSKWAFAFALSLSKLGDLQVTVNLSGKTVDVKINVKKLETLGVLHSFFDEIKNNLGKFGLTLRDWKLQFGLENNDIDVENLHLLDIRI